MTMTMAGNPGILGGKSTHCLDGFVVGISTAPAGPPDEDKTIVEEDVSWAAFGAHD